MHVPPRGPLRRILPIAFVPLALLATVHVGHASASDGTRRLHARVDDVVTTMANALAGMRLFTDPEAIVKREADELRRVRADERQHRLRLAERLLGLRERLVGEPAE